VQPHRSRKANIISLNTCECGIDISNDEIQKQETVMKCSVEGCETVWVCDSLFVSILLILILLSSIWDASKLIMHRDSGPVIVVGEIMVSVAAVVTS
jgi:hypothetical protein